MSNHPQPHDVKRTVIRTSSGTTGIPHVVIRRLTPQNPEFQQVKRPMLLVGALSGRLNHLARCLYDEKMSVETVLCVDPRDINGELDGIVHDFGPDGLWALPVSFGTRSLEYIKQESLQKVERCSAGGENFSKEHAMLFKQKMPQTFLIVPYATSEAGAIGQACPHLPFGAYHPAEGVTVHIENSVDGIGEIVVSNVLVKDHRPGDSVRFLGPCQCGKEVSFEVLGRTGFDFIRLGGAVLRQEEFDRVIGALSQYVADYRVVVRPVLEGERIKGEITLLLIAHPPLLERTDAKTFIAQTIAEQLFVSPSRTLAELIAEKFYLPLIVSFVDSFPFQQKNVKMRLRKESAD